MVACSVLTNLDDLSGGGDATSDVASDVASDVTITDAGMDVIGDADADTGPTVPFSCSQVDATFCDDFEGDGSLVPPWTSLATQNGGALTHVVQDSGCILVALGGGDAAPYAYLTKAFTASASKVHYAFDLQVRSYATSSGAVANVNQFYLPFIDSGAFISGYVYLALWGPRAASSSSITRWTPGSAHR
jgi:hypothetical protein